MYVRANISRETLLNLRKRGCFNVHMRDALDNHVNIYGHTRRNYVKCHRRSVKKCSTIEREVQGENKRVGLESNALLTTLPL